MLVGGSCLLVWGGLFAAGLLVATLPYRMHISLLASASDVAATVTGVMGDAETVEEAAQGLLAAADSSEAGQDSAITPPPAADQGSQATARDSTLTQIADNIRNVVRPIEGPVLWSWIVVLLCYTPTNILLLSLLAGVLGSLGCLANVDWRYRGRNEPCTEDEGDKAATGCDRIDPCFSGLVRGLFVYLLLISGLLILTEDPFTNLNAARYVRLAGVTSMISFVVSLKPSLFARLLGRAEHTAGRTSPGQ